MNGKPMNPPPSNVTVHQALPLAPRLLPWLVGVVGLIAIGWWWSSAQMTLVSRLPGADREEGTGAAGGVSSRWEGRLIQGPGLPAPLEGAWPRFRGPNADAISTDPTPLTRQFKETGPPVLWKIPVGEGYAAPAIWKGRVYLMDYDHQNAADALRCLSLADGQEIWRYTYPVKVKRDHGMSRTIPTVTEKFTVAIGPKCHVVCVDTLTGELRWQMNLVSEFGTEIPPWYAGQCPFVDGDRLILGTGGEALMVAVELATGKVLWKSANPRNWQMTHSSVVPVEFNGQRQYVYCASGGVAGVSASDGRLLWDTPDWKISIANVPSPIDLGQGRIFLCGGYNAGALFIQLREEGGEIKVATGPRLKAATFGATQQTPILYQNHLFGVRPDGQLVCLNLEGQPVWESGTTQRFGNGPFLLAQGMLLVMNDAGTLTLAEASTAGYRPLAQARILQGHDSWGPLALAAGRLLARDLTEMVCVDLAEK
jgi:outer membrane protein assembly factor BamB